jgi:hypothetical protein
MSDTPINFATKEDIAELRVELRTEFHGTADSLRERMEKLEQRTDERLDGLEERLEERIRDSQTELLKAFYGFTETVRQRFQG